MPKLSMPFADSSASRSDYVRPKRLGFHTVNVRESEGEAIACAQVSESTQSSRRDTLRDSSNFRAAQALMQEREEAGLTLEEAAAIANVSMTTVWRRESGRVDLGPLKQLIALRRARGVKAK